MPKKPSLRAAKPAPPISNAAPVMAPGDIPSYALPTHYGGLSDTGAAGIRSLPMSAPWTNRTFQGRNRSRVLIARALDEKVPLAGYLNSAIPQEALGDGMSVVSLSEDRKFRKDASAYFAAWASSPKIDVRGEVNFYSAQSLLGYFIERDGEVCAMKVRSNNPADFKRPLSDRGFRALQLQFLRRDQIGTQGTALPEGDPQNTRWDDGIFLDDLDRAKTFRVLRRRGALEIVTDFVDVPASLMLHLKKPTLEGIHGQPAAFRGQDCALDLLDVRALSKHSDKIRAAFLGVITTATGSAPASMRQNIKPGAKPDGSVIREDKSVRYYEVGSGVQIPILKKDESISFFNGQTTLSFGEQIAMLYREIILARNIPPEYIHDVANLGSGAVRMILRKVGKPLDAIRRPFRDVFCQQTWEFVIGDAIARGVLPNVADWNVIETRNEPDPSIDAGRDETGEQNKIRAHLGTRRRYYARIGEDGDHIGRERIDEIFEDIQYGESLKSDQFPKGLPWQLCLDPAIVQAFAGAMAGAAPPIPLPA